MQPSYIPIKIGFYNVAPVKKFKTLKNKILDISNELIIKPEE